MDRFGDIAAPRWLQAFLILFVGQHYGLLFWALVPATIMLAAERQDTPARRITRLFGVVALVWFVVLSYVFFFLWILPRYQLVTAAALVVPLSLVLARMAWRGRAVLAALVVLAILASDVVLIAATNRDPLWAERTLVAYAQRHAGVVQTDPGTLRGAEWLLQIRGIAARVRAAAPEPGQTYFYDAAPRRGIPQGWPVQRPDPKWVALARFSQRRGPGAVLINRLGLLRIASGGDPAQARPSAAHGDALSRTPSAGLGRVGNQPPDRGSLRSSAASPGVNQSDAQGIEVGDIARHEREIMSFGRRRDEGVHRAHRTAPGLAAGHDAAP